MRVNSLNTKWKEFLFAFTGFGPNFLMVLMGAFFTDAMNPAALPEGSFQAIASGTCFILPLVFPTVYAIAKAFDGIIDIPFAHITDTLSTKWGRRRPAIAVCFIPMVLSYAMCWWPVGGTNQLFNTIWIAIWSLIFFSTYTMCLIAYYGSLSTTCKDEPQRLRVSGYKSFFDTISYCLVYALVPLILDGLQLRIDKFVFICLPIMLTMIIPLFLIKEGEKYGYPENDGLVAEKISIFESLKLTFKNRVFARWLIINACTYFGLQMFLVGMNSMILGGMGLNGGQMAILNTCAFAPVPIMLYMFNKLKAKKGTRFTYQTCLISFAVAILSFFLGSTYVCGDNTTLKIIIGCVGGVFGSWAIGAFFMMPYLITAQVSSVEEKLTGKNHSAMYFAANAVVTSVAGAISGSLIYELIKNLFISKEAGGVKLGIADITTGVSALENAAAQFGVAEGSVYNLGTLMIPFIVAIVCIIGAILAIKMPKDYTPELVAKELKKHDPSIDLSVIEKDESYAPKEEKGEIIFVQIGLSILSGFIFGFIWLGYLLRSLTEITGKKYGVGTYLLCALVPFASAFVMAKAYRDLNEALGTEGKATALYIILGIIFPILPINVIALALLQSKANKAYKLAEQQAEPVIA